MSRRQRITCGGVAVALACIAAPADAQARPAGDDTVAVSIEHAVAVAVGSSEEVRLARTQVRLAEAQVGTARAEAFPRIDARVGYTRTFASPFATNGFTLPESLRFAPDSLATVADRLKYLEKHTPLAGLGGLGQLFGNLPFGQRNLYTAALVASQPLFSGGRIGAGLEIANEFLEAASLDLQEQTADIELQVRTAYYHARLAQELVGISEAALDQARKFLASERLRRESGTGSELDVLRAEVSVANLEPQLVDARNAADIATLDLKRLIDVPLGQPVVLTTSLDVPPVVEDVDTTRAARLLSRRAALTAQERQVAIRQDEVRIARAAYLPDISLGVNYGRQLYPTRMFSLNEQWRSDVSASVVASMSLFDMGRIRGQVAQAELAVEQERLHLTQLRELVQLGYQRALGERERARATLGARQLTVRQAQRVYDLTVLRYEQGLASQLEVSDARLALLQARTNLAQGVADFFIADANLSRALGAPTPR